MCVPPPQTSHHQAFWEGSNTATALLPWTLAKTRSNYLFVKPGLFPLLSTVVYPPSSMLSFLVLYFPIKNTSCSKQKDKAHVPPDKTQSPEWQQGKGSAGVPVTGSQTWSQTGGRNAVCLIPAHAEPSPGPFCFGQILFLMLIMVMGLWAKPNKQLYGFPLNKPDSLFLLFWCHPNAGMVINHREMCY